jgi:hypothetical protein
MNEAQKIMKGEDLTHLAGQMEEKPTQEDCIELAGDLLGVIALANELPTDFVGIHLSVIKDSETGQLKAVILSPVDMYGDEPFARYAVDPTATAKAKGPKIALVN